MIALQNIGYRLVSFLFWYVGIILLVFASLAAFVVNIGAEQDAAVERRQKILASLTMDDIDWQNCQLVTLRKDNTIELVCQRK